MIIKRLIITLSGLFVASLNQANGLAPYFEQQSLRSHVVAYGSRVDLGGQTRKYTVVIQDPETRSWCSGALIHPRVILTAAHCLYDKEIFDETEEIVARPSVNIRFGRDNDDPHKFVTTSEELVMHPGFRGTYPGTDNKASSAELGDPRKDVPVPEKWEYLEKLRKDIKAQPELALYFIGNGRYFDYVSDDIGLVFLDQDAPEPFKPVRFLSFEEHGSHLPIRTELYAVGFGLSNLTFSNADINQDADNPILRFAMYDFYQMFFKPNSRFRTAGDAAPKKDQFACGGDSGGPVLVKTNGELKLIGTISHQDSECLGFMSFVYSWEYTYWIQDSMTKKGIFGVTL